MIQFGNVVIDDATREVLVDGAVQHLEPQAFDVLWLLVCNPDRVVPKTELLDTVWGDQFVSESALTTRIKEIRRAVGDDGRSQRIVRTVRGTGYRFVADIVSVDEAAFGRAPSAATMRLRPNTVERRAGQRVAYATIGSGPPLLFMPGWISSLDAFADGTDPRAPLIARLADDFSVTVFDRFGTGLSAAEEVDTSLEASVDEVLAVLGTIESGPAVVFASSAAGPAALLAAAGNEKVARLVLLCTYANGPTLFSNPQNKANLIELVETSWGMGSRILADMIVPGIDAVTRSVFARFQRRTATPGVAAGYIRQLYDADATEVLSAIEQPCLVMHYRNDPAIPFAGGRQLAMGVDDTEFVPLDGPYHTPPAADVEHLATIVARFSGL